MSFIYVAAALILLILTLLILINVTSPYYDRPSLKVVYNTLARDIRAGIRFMKVKAFCTKAHLSDQGIADIFRNVVKKHPNKTCFIFEDKKWTFQEVEDISNKIANIFINAGYKKGDEVALFMENCVEYICIWLGLSKIGVISALINYNLRMHSLAHSINVVQTKAIIFNAQLASAVRDVIPLTDRKSEIQCYCIGNINPGSNSFLVHSLDTLLQEASSKPISHTKYPSGFTDKLFYIYTSGTTGLPKAAIIRHSRFMWIGAASRFAVLLYDDDVFYNPLPLYHAAGGMLFLSTVLMFGGTMIIRKKFSASNFWKDAIKYKATVSQYIGEICRFLLTQPRKPEDTQHTIRLVCGNGLRPQLWREFKERFRIKYIIEIYGATEGNANVANLFSKPGSVGFLTRIFSPLYPVRLIKVNPETGEPLRNKNGLCILCKPGEPGEIVGRILRNNPVNAFDGYASESATKKKIVRDCFKKGDAAFLSGDILVMDEDGYLYFMDRTGDTYKWRGENVSTAEVESITSKVLSFAACVAYGVEIPGTEGRAGMVAIQTENPIDINLLYSELSQSLPSYAVPIFVRICQQIETTGTYKLRKVELQTEGYDLEKVTDPIYFLHPAKRAYVRLDEELYTQIRHGSLRL